MSMTSRTVSVSRHLSALGAAMVLAAWTPAAAQSTAAPPAPAGGPTFQATAGPAPASTPDRAEHRAYVTCNAAPFYYWEPHSGSDPSRASYPPAKFGDSFGVVGKPVITRAGLILYQTTIPILPPYGGGKWYWVPQSCLNVIRE
jgi:hypothetical protein